MAESRAEILDYLANVESEYSAYHAQKEVGAWAGVALLATVVPLVLAVLESGPTSLVRSILATCAIVALSACVTAYVRTQFRLKAVAADLVAACSWLQADIVSTPDANPDPAGFAPRRSRDKLVQAPYVLGSAILDKADEFGHRGQGARSRLEKGAYGLILVISLVAVLWTWLPSSV